MCLYFQGNCHEKFSRSPVCGLDSVTYSSYCAAATQLVPVDYGGSCVATDVMRELLTSNFTLFLTDCFLVMT